MLELETNLSRRFSEKRQDFTANSGSPEKVVYAGHYDNDGKFSVQPVGNVNLYEEIQVYADSVSIDTLLNRFSCGDPMALERCSSFFADVSELPGSYVGLFNMIQDIRTFFDKMPADFKEKFDNNFETFMSSAEAMDFLPKLKNDDSGKVVNPTIPIEKPVKESIENES